MRRRSLNLRLDALQRMYDALDPEKNLVEAPPEIAAPGTAAQTKTAVPLDRLRALNDSLLTVPPRTSRSIASSSAAASGAGRRSRPRPNARSTGRPPRSWRSRRILEDGTPIRLTGEDVERGTFSHRHAVLYDAQNGTRFSPLQSLPQAKASFEIRNSPLSENAAIGFEYGYDIQAPERLVIWEAQYGDFINGAQLMLDEFVLSARAKWGQEPSLVMLLPHGYEGQGPDHASARPERFLQLAADINMRVANCTTAAQYFHLLRRQAALLVKDPLPLVVLSPKSLLRHPFVASAPRDLAEGRWMKVIDDEDAVEARGGDPPPRLLQRQDRGGPADQPAPRRSRRPSPSRRVEQLYPLPVNEMLRTIDSYPKLEEVLWVQEEPENMGAWEFVRPQLEGLVGARRLAVLARPRSSSPSEGSAARHAKNQERLLARAFEVGANARSRQNAERRSSCGAD